MKTKPREINLAVGLYGVSLALGLVKAFLEWAYLRSSASVSLIAGVLGCTLAILSLLLWKVAQGRNWARITLLVFFLLFLPSSCLDIRAEFARSTIQGVLSIVQIALQTAALLFIFIGPGKEWFRRESAQP